MKIIQIVSHNSTLVALGDDGKIYGRQTTPDAIYWQEIPGPPDNADVEVEGTETAMCFDMAAYVESKIGTTQHEYTGIENDRYLWTYAQGGTENLVVVFDQKPPGKKFSGIRVDFPETHQQALNEVRDLIRGWSI